MIRKLFYSFLLFTFPLAQTHITIPQNVWRISLQQYISTGKWIGHDGKNGWRDYSYVYNGSDYTIHQYWERNLNTQSLQIEYGLTDRSTFTMNVPRIQKLEQFHSWTVTGAESQADLDSIMAYFFPKNKTNSGLGDVTIGMNILFIGNPAWRSGRQKYSIYGGIDATFPFGERLEEYFPKEVDANFPSAMALPGGGAVCLENYTEKCGGGLSISIGLSVVPPIAGESLIPHIHSCGKRIPTWIRLQYT